MKVQSKQFNIAAGFVLGAGAAAILALLLCLDQVVGWDATWRAFGVTPLQPHFFDMHVVMDYAACAAKGIDPYVPHACNPDNYNIPPLWLLVGRLGLNGFDSTWLSIAIIAAAFAVVVLLFWGRSAAEGAVALLAIVSPTVLMGVERGNLDLLILALVGSAALIYPKRKMGSFVTMALIALATALKLFPVFTVAILARFSRRTVGVGVSILLFSLIYLLATWEYVVLIGRNVPTTFILSYGYKAAFLGIDHLRAEAGRSSIGIAETTVPLFAVVAVLVAAAIVVLIRLQRGGVDFAVTDNVAGFAFLAGAGIYCGTYVLGTNFDYRLMFLLLCLPQLLDWQSDDRVPRGHALILLCSLVGVLWLNGIANGHTTFLLLPQFLDWALFFGLTVVLMSNLSHSIITARDWLHR